MDLIVTFICFFSMFNIISNINVAGAASGRGNHVRK